MAVLNQLAYTLADWRGRLDPSGNVDDIIEVLSQSNPIFRRNDFYGGQSSYWDRDYSTYKSS